jgi:hypothetical protein
VVYAGFSNIMMERIGLRICGVHSRARKVYNVVVVASKKAERLLICVEVYFMNLKFSF